MKQNLNLICEAKLSLGKMADEGENPSGIIEAKVTTFGPREGADGRKFFYKPEGFAQWADEFASAGKPLPMFLNHNDMGMPVGQWDEFIMEDDGMSAKGKIYMNTVGGSDLYSVLKEAPNMFGGVSVGAYADEARMVDEQGNPIGDDEDEGYFQITKGGLREVSVVMYPNNPNAENQKNNLILILILILTLQFLIPPVSALPSAGDNFEYTIIRKVGSGSGEYSGYSDELNIHKITFTDYSFHPVHTNFAYG